MEKDNLLIICPNSYKMRLLDKLSKDDTLYDIKFMTKSEFFKNYFLTSNIYFNICFFFLRM